MALKVSGALPFKALAPPLTLLGVAYAALGLVVIPVRVGQAYFQLSKCRSFASLVGIAFVG